MKKAIYILITILLTILPMNVKAEEKTVTIYFFRGSTCEYCEAALDYINNHKDEIPENIEIVTYEVWENSINESLHQAVVTELEVASSSQNSVPFIVIGDTYQVGMDATQTAFEKIINIAESYLEDDEYEDVVAKLIKENNYKVTSKSLDDLYSEPSKVVTIVVYVIFGLVIVGFIGMIVFSRK